MGRPNRQNRSIIQLTFVYCFYNFNQTIVIIILLKSIILAHKAANIGLNSLLVGGLTTYKS